MLMKAKLLRACTALKVFFLFLCQMTTGRPKVLSGLSGNHPHSRPWKTYRQAGPHLTLPSKILPSQISKLSPPSLPSLRQLQQSSAVFHSPLRNSCFLWEIFFNLRSSSALLLWDVKFPLLLPFRMFYLTHFQHSIISCELSGLLSTETTQIYIPDHTEKSPN